MLYDLMGDSHAKQLSTAKMISWHVEQVGFNVELGGYFSIKRNAQSINGNTFVRRDQAAAYCKALLEFFR